MGEILNLRQKAVKEEKAKVFKIVVPFVALLSIIQTFINIFLTPHYELINIITHIEDFSVVLAATWGYVTKFEKVAKITFALLPVSLIGLLFRIYVAEGVQNTDATLWLFLFPIAASYFISYRYAYGLALAITASLISISGTLYFQGKEWGDPGYIVGVIGIFWIITFTICRYEKNKHKALELIDAEIRQRQIANSHYSTSQIVQGFAHEINNPLCIINLFIQQLEFENKISEEEKEQIGNNILRITDLISGLKERIAKHNPRLNNREVALGEVLSTVLSYFREECDHRKITLNSHLRLLEKIQTPVIETELFEAISFIINNAIENAETSQNRTVSIFYYEDLGQIHINDSGPDFSSESKALAFNTFYTTKNGHSGIGLSVAKELLRKNKLSINITDMSKGKVIISLPS